MSKSSEGNHANARTCDIGTKSCIANFFLAGCNPFIGEIIEQTMGVL